jgi:hypothetical protein
MDKVSAKKEMLKELSKQMKASKREKAGKGLGDKMAVKVMSDSPEGLKEGLSRAEQLLDERKEMLGLKDKEYKKEEDCEECKGEGCEACEEESPKEEPSEEESPEDLKKEIEELKAKLAEKE